MLTKWIAKVAGVLLLCLALSAAASAQYGGGGGMGGSGGSGSSGTGTTNGYGSGNGKAVGIGAGVAAAAVVGVVLLVHHHHAAEKSSQASLLGCTQHDSHGISLTNENDNQSYALIPGSTLLQPGDRLELKGVMTDEGSTTHAFRVNYIVKNYGACGPVSAGTSASVTGTVAVAQAAH
jgi:hypothetical protein